MEYNLQDLENILKKHELFKHSKISKIIKLKGDASGRIYSRILLNNSIIKSIILMQVVGGSGPKAAGDTSLNEDQAFLNIGNYFYEQGIPVPKIYISNLDQKILIVEDAGSYGLNQFCENDLPQNLKEEFSFWKDPKLELFKSAINIIKKLQDCPKIEDCLAFRRFLAFEQYQTEASSIIHNYLEPLKISKVYQTRTQELINNLCEDLVAHPKTLIHRDFMPWNLQVSVTGKLFLIDFQDALQASCEFDLVCLLHDRDVDLKLGDEFLLTIIKYYQQVFNRDQNFEKRYQDILLHRYIRLSGHFNLLTNKTNNPIYRNWIPGCLFRLGRILCQLPDYADLIDILGKNSKDLISGTNQAFKINE